MLVLLIFGLMTAIGIILLIVARSFECYTSYDLDFGLNVTGIVLIILFGIGLIIASAFAMGVQLPKEKNYQKVLYQKQVLEYRLDHIEDNLVGNEILYSEITDFNNLLRECKYYADNPWIGLFYNDKIATIDYIVLPLQGTNYGLSDVQP